jgi:hypothetical protein
VSKSSDRFSVLIRFHSDLEMLTDLNGIKALLLSCWMDGQAESKKYVDLTRRLLRVGCRFFACFGAYAERMHDTIDDTLIQEETIRNITYNDVVTTFHSNETPNDMALFFLNHCRLSGISGRLLVVLDENRQVDEALGEMIVQRVQRDGGA